MSQYLTPNDPNAFLDLEIQPIKHNDNPAVCPLCKGYGKWNLTINAYGPGKHFQAHCMQCNGWGWVIKGTHSETCIHDYVELSYNECQEQGIKHYGMCWHVSKCSKCGDVIAYDSSD